MENHVTVDIDDGHESVNTDVSEWSTAQVKSWLRQNGYKEIEVGYIKLLLKAGIH